MNQLQDLAQRQPYWTLEEFVQVANQLLPEVLPDERANTRVREEVTPRLVRHYTTQGMVDEPLKQGREARYQYRHLLQVLLLRRLLTAGFGAGAIAQFAIDRTNTELETLLQGDIQLAIASTPSKAVESTAESVDSADRSSNPALEFLQQIQTRSKPPAAPPQAAPAPPPLAKQARTRQSATPPSTPQPTQWTRIELVPGLELHRSAQFSFPQDPIAQQQLLAHILQTLQSHLISGETHDSTVTTDP